MKTNELEILISEQEIKEKISSIAQQLDLFYAGRELVIVMVMKGAICLAADLLRSLKTPATVDFVQASSYGKRGTQRGELTLFGAEELTLAGKDVLLIDDIFDSGVTLSSLAQALQVQQPRSLQTLVLLSKKVPRQIDFIPDYTLFEVENRFVVGYGLDYQELYRGLPGIYIFRVEAT